MEYPDESEKFSNLIKLPNETLERVCWNMDPKTLGRFAQVYKRAADVCDIVIQQRKKEDIERRKYINDTVAMFHNPRTSSITFQKFDGQVKSEVSVFKVQDHEDVDTFTVNQKIIPNIIDIDWPFPNLDYDEFSVFNYTIRHTQEYNTDLVPYIIGRLYDEYYDLFNTE